MLFNSTAYLIFLTVVVLLYHQLPPRGRRWLILISSLIFYGSWNAKFLGLIAFYIVANYCFGILIGLPDNPRKKRGLMLAIAVSTNLLVLSLFKYAVFFSDATAGLFGYRVIPALHWLLPLGISFFTFEVISYEVDVYRGVTRPMRNLMDMALYVTFFPHLIAGPIIRSEDLVPQLTADQPFNWSNIRVGLARFFWGMVKKVFLADVMAKVVKEVYGTPVAYSGGGLLLGTYAFAVQIYCDFSAYSDMAIGSALMLNIRLPENFDMPYLSCSIREFWRRWHISLSTWLRDYLYIPLGGSRAGKIRTYVNLLITMLLGGLWHGAAWSFIVWGGLHGAAMCFERRFNVSEKPPPQMGWRLLRWIITFHVVCASWILFRAQDMHTAFLIFKRIVLAAPGNMPADYRPLIYLFAVLAAELLATRKAWIALIDNRPVLARWVAYGGATFFMLAFAKAGNPEFIYFQF